MLYLGPTPLHDSADPQLWISGERGLGLLTPHAVVPQGQLLFRNSFPLDRLAGQSNGSARSSYNVNVIDAPSCGLPKAHGSLLPYYSALFVSDDASSHAVKPGYLWKRKSIQTTTTSPGTGRSVSRRGYHLSLDLTDQLRKRRLTTYAVRFFRIFLLSMPVSLVQLWA